MNSYEQEVKDAEDINSELKNTLERLSNLQDSFDQEKCIEKNLATEKKHLEARHIQKL